MGPLDVSRRLWDTLETLVYTSSTIEIWPLSRPRYVS